MSNEAEMALVSQNMILDNLVEQITALDAEIARLRAFANYVLESAAPESQLANYANFVLGRGPGGDYLTGDDDNLPPYQEKMPCVSV